MEEREIAEKKAWIALGLRDTEYQQINELLGRAPNWTELGLFSVLWSEHCGYKHSRPYLKDLPVTGPAVLVGPGENAGVVDVGDGWAVAFRIESHNHPIAIEPFQGAATGIGGIIRDILAMGARPIALLDSLRFGRPGDGRTAFLFGGVVAGISHYGNSVGVPTVGGEIYFEEAYRENPLCNVMAVGLLRKDHLTLGVASGVGNAILLMGAPTGRDGIHGATFASAELDEHSEERRPSVQVGDPFREKVLIEACLELLETGSVVGLQDLGAAGLASSSAEMASRAGSGAELDLAVVPRREEGMTPYELMLSETQERMLAIVEWDRVDEALAICRKWDLPAVVAGRVTDDGYLRVRDGAEVVAELPARLLTEEAPTYRVSPRRPAGQDELLAFDPATLPEPADLGAVLRKLLSAPNLASRAPVYGQYDHEVQTNTVEAPGVGAAVLRLKGTEKGLALTVDGQARYVFLDPFVGGQIAVAESYRNLVAVGARPLGLTNCLNFGNPEKPEVAWQFQEAVRGLGVASAALGVPVTGGNVSFYNESPAGPILPTPVIGMVGLLRLENRLGPGFRRAGDQLLLLGETRGELGGSEYLRELAGRLAGRPPRIDLAQEAATAGIVLAAAEKGLLSSAQDLSDGGLWIALCESAVAGAKGARGARLTVPAGLRPDFFLLGEDQGRFLLSLSPEKWEAFRLLPGLDQVPHRLLGEVASDEITILGPTGELFSARSEELFAERAGALGRWLG